VLVPVSDTDLSYPVHRIYCVGRNYADHAREMGASGREEPFFFCKPADAVLPLAGDGDVIAYPDLTDDLQHEVELVVALGAGGDRVNRAQAGALVWAYAVGIDLTRRDLQVEAKRTGRPWEVGKSFDRSAPMGPLRRLQDVGTIRAGRIWLDVNGTRRQQGDLSQMIWGIEDTISKLSDFFRLAAGDLIFTGTPAGVGRLAPGDRLEAGIEHVGTIGAIVGARAERRRSDAPA